MYFKVYPNSDPDKRYAEMVAGEYQYSGVVMVPNEVTLDDVEYPVKIIASKCFANCKLLKQVVLGDNVTTIKNQAFYYSGDASEILDYKGVKRNGVTVNLDAPSLTTIEAGAFSSTSLTPPDGILTIGKNVTSIGDTKTSLFSWARFYGYKVVVADGNTSYVVGSDGVLYDKDKTKLVLFPYFAGGVDYTTPASVTRVLSHSMYDFSSSLKSFTDGGGLEYVGSIGWGCAEISLGSKLTTLSEQYRLCGATKLNLTIDAANPKYKVIEDANGNRGLYELNDSGVAYKLLKAFQTNGKSGSYGSDTFILPTTVSHIASLAFYQCTSLKYVDCQNNTVLSADNIDNNAAPAPVSITYTNISLYAERDGEEGIEYTKDMKKLVNWSSNANVVNYVMPETVTTIAGSGMHDNQYAKTFDIGPNLSLSGSEGDGYFWRLTNLEKFTNSRNNTKGLFVFDDALYRKSNGIITLVSYPSGKKAYTYTVADGTKELSGNTGTPDLRAFNKTNLYAVDLGDDVTTIRYKAMRDMSNLAVLRLASPVVPTASSGSFYGTASVDNQKVLCVPHDLQDIYKANSVFNTCFKFVDDEDKYYEYIKAIVIKYDIEHLKQNIDNDDYSSTAETGVVGNLMCKTKAEEHVLTGAMIKGFHVVKTEDVILEEYGATAKIYYDRDLYTVTWMNGATTVATGTERYQTPLAAPDASEVTPPAGKSFFGWHTNPESSMALSLTDAIYEGDVTYYALFADNAKKKYIVKHLLQNINDNDYTEDVASRTEGEAAWGTQTTASAKSFTGFTAKAFEQKTIAEDGSTVVEIKYDRNSYTVTWMNGSTKLSSATKRYGVALTAPTAPAAAAGKHFVGWNTDKTASSAVVVPAQYEANATYYAIYVDNASVSYSIKHMLQNIAGTSYVLDETESGHGIAGTQTDARAKIITGFTAKAVTQKTIAENGSTVVEIQYDRNKYDVVWMNGTTELSSAKVAYGAAITAPAAPAAVAGKHFAGWNTVTNATEVLDLSGATVSADVTYYATFFDNATVSYSVVHMTQKLDGTFEERANSTGMGVAGLMTAASAVEYDGFTAQPFDQKVIAENGSTVVEIRYTRNSYALAYDNLQGATIKNSSGYTKAGAVKFESSLVMPVLVRTGYTYQWSTIPPTTMPSEPVTMTAVWTANTYKDYWDFNDGKSGAVTGETKFGEVIRKPDAILSKEGYNFIGWARKETPTVVIADDNFGTMPANDVYFIAVWELKDVTYSVKHNFENLDGSFVENETLRESVTTKYGSLSQAVAKSVDGFTAQTIAQKVVENDGVVIEVNYMRNSYVLTWINEKPEATTTNESSYTKSGSVKYGAPIVAPVYVLEGYTCSWNASVPSTMTAANVTLTAQYTANIYNISVADAEGCLKVTVASSAAYGSTVVINPITAKEGYELKSIDADKATIEMVDSKYSFTMPASNVVITPVFKKSLYDITVETVSGGKVTASAASATMGETVTFAIEANTGWKLTSLTSSDATVNVAADKLSASITMPAKAVTVTPLFEKINYNISVGEVNHGSVSVAGGKTSAQYGDMVTVEITPSAGYHFTAFMVNGETYVLSDNKFEMPASDVTISATFSAEGYGITIMPVEGGSVTAEKNNDVIIDEKVNLTITTNPGYEFVGMTASNGATIAVAADKNSAVLTMGADNTTVTPQFKKLGLSVGFTANDGNEVEVYVGDVKTDVAGVGDEVVLVFKPAKGYVFDMVTADGIDFIMTANGAKFTMPASNVTGSVKFNKIIYSIKYKDADHGKISGAESASYKDNVIVAIDADEYYEIVSLTAEHGEVTISDDKSSATLVMDAEDETLSAVFAKKQYRIQVSATGNGSLVPSVEYAGIGDVVNVAINPETGNALDGDVSIVGATWEYTADKQGVILTVTDEVVVVSATFVEKHYLVNYEGAHCDVKAPTSALYNENITITVTPGLGYEVVSVTINDADVTLSTDGSCSYIMPDNDIMISVVTAAIDYNVSVGDVENGEVVVYRSIAHVGDEIEVGYEPAEGFHLINIYVNGEVKGLSERNTFIMPAEDVVVTAKFSETGYGISVLDVEGGTVIPSVDEANIGDVVDLKIVPSAGYEFVSLKLAEGQNGKITDVNADALTAKLEMAAENATIVPEFRKSAFKISFTANATNSVECVETANLGDKVTVSFTADKGYKFESIAAEGIEFVVAADALSATFTMPAANVTGSVTFAKIDYSILYAEADNGAINGAVVANYGDVVEIKIQPADNYELAGITAANGSSITVSEDKLTAELTMGAANEIITATFAKRLFAVTLVESDYGSMEADKDKAGFGDKVTVIVKPVEGYTVDKVLVNGVEYMVDESRTVIFDMPAEAVEVEAQYTKSGVDPIVPSCFNEAKAVAYYNWLLMVDKNDLEAKGAVVDESMVTWYKVVGDLDDPCDDNAILDDEPVKTGFYFTSDTNLKGSGDYYAVIVTKDAKYRTEVFYFADKKAPISMAPTRASRGQIIKVKGLADEATIAVYDMNGRLLKVINTEGTQTYDLQAEDNSGMYIVNIITDGEERSIKYIVK